MKNPNFLKITQKLVITKWCESFECVIGIRTIHLAYVISRDEYVLVVAPPLVHNQPYFSDNGSFEEDLIACDTYNHVQLCDDKAKCTIYWKRQLGQQAIQPLSSHSNAAKIGEEHERQYLIIMLEKTSGDLNSRKKMNSSTHASGKTNQNFS